MDDFLLYLVPVLLLNIVVGMVRVLRGPSAADRMLAAEMFSTSAVAVLLLLAIVGGNDILLDVALVFALLSALAVVTFVRRAWSSTASSQTQNEKE
ncbi:monovalent cation/H+ antiporter complex subunit F [Alkalilimnicola ehrlichii]|uniref:Multiple resistance and pH regulation protein F n=1 Tax=Alkalilimnicola ehrlichii TaxID=351052 RepID=A0A3E0WXZ8_9GAMM|nr:monovalent cation/H+ antiporter complex subunit F [Alkalilimnicola ehrlichii]RFA36896.1 multiple resistance and pH regulation protein F [Alkalilimnicola ehrlichii]